VLFEAGRARPLDIHGGIRERRGVGANIGGLISGWASEVLIAEKVVACSNAPPRAYPGLEPWCRLHPAMIYPAGDGKKKCPNFNDAELTAAVIRKLRRENARRPRQNS